MEQENLSSRNCREAGVGLVPVPVDRERENPKRGKP